MRISIICVLIYYIYAVALFATTEEKIIYDSKGSIRRLSDESQKEDAFFSPSSAMRINEYETVGKKYDELRRLVSEIVWHDNSATEMKQYFYHNEQISPYKTETFSAKNNTLRETVFNDKGFPLSETVFTLKKTQAEGAVYDVLLMSALLAEQNNKADFVQTERFEYTYADDGAKLRLLRYYSGEVLTSEIRYVSTDERTETVFFDDGITVTSYYKDGIKVREVYAENGVTQYERIR